MKKNDIFADIAAGGIQCRGASLTVPEPPKKEKKYLNMDIVDESAIFKPIQKMTSFEELERELEKKRNHYKDFMRNLAPEPKSYRILTPLIKFDWRVGIEEDMMDFSRVLDGRGEWAKVQIPHYGGPLGKAVTYYRTVFDITGEQMDTGAVFICFKGVDYRAHVYINGTYSGSHEGFFAPFEFEITPYARAGKNVLVVRVENDFICMGNETPETGGVPYTGDKIYAATGPGYDDPQFGWHHCPPGMGIYQDVYIEARARVHIQDIFVRPVLDGKKAEAWIEVYSCDIESKDITFNLALYG